jgi:apolipoprotein N-acyltransferase
MPFWFLSFIAFIPLLNFIEKQIDGKSKTNFFWNIYLIFFIYHTGSNWWISSFQEQTDPFLMASGFAMDLFHPFFFFIPTYIYYRIRRKFGFKIAAPMFPIIWTGWEYFHGLGEFSYPWLAVGNTQIYNLTWLQFIDITGVFGASFLIVLTNTALFITYRNIINGRVQVKPGINTSWFLLTLCIIIIPLIYGLNKIEEFDNINVEGEKVNIGIVQPNKFPWAKWSAGEIDQIRTMIGISDSLKTENPEINLFLWPETSILSVRRYGFNEAKDLWFLQDWVDTSNVILISGFVHRYIYKENEQMQITARPYGDTGKFYEHFNSALLLNPNSQAQTYHKMILTPFAERIPNVDYFSFLMDYIKWGVGISSWGLGQDQHNLIMADSTKIGNIICIESIYPEFCKNFSDQGAEIFTIITNDSWYDGTPGPEQHWLIARIRAIENRRYIARSANSGVSGFIAPNGKEISRLDQYKMSGIEGSVKKIDKKTFYAKNGDILARTFMYLASIFWLMSFIYRKK